MKLSKIALTLFAGVFGMGMAHAQGISGDAVKIGLISDMSDRKSVV